MSSYMEVGADGAAFSEPFQIKDVMSSWGFLVAQTDRELFVPVKQNEETEEGYIQVLFK